jgi:hypothetical protein
MIFPFFILLQQQSMGETIGYQIHSYDDVAEWPSAFAKGAAHLKIDPQYRTKPFCRNQTHDIAHDPRGCFVLNHDRAGGRTDYNTAMMLLRFSTIRANAPILSTCCVGAVCALLQIRGIHRALRQ